MMKTLLVAFTVFLSSTSLLAQQWPEWVRVYTFDDSIIEMNTSEVRFGNGNTARVKFRWTFEKPEAQTGEPNVKYKSKLELFEFDCERHRFRPVEVDFYDAAGKFIQVDRLSPDAAWTSSASSTMIEKFFAPACRLIEYRRNPPLDSATLDSTENLELKRVKELSISFTKQLEKTRDFKPLVKEFFAPDYLDRYLKEKDTNWFLNLSRETATKIRRAELERFYFASLNAGYLSNFYLLSQSSEETDESVAEEKLVPPDVLQLIKIHPYTVRYKGQTAGNYDYLAENIDSVERLRSYTDLLEKISALMRKHIQETKTGAPPKYQNFLQEWYNNGDFYNPQKIMHCGDCLGFPPGTGLFEVNIPLLQIRLADISGELKIVSALDSPQ